MAASLCGGVVSSRRGLLALLWSLVISLTAVAFLLALLFILSSQSSPNYDEYNDDKDANQNSSVSVEMAITSRAMAFAALWTAVLASLLAIFCTVILGWQSPTGQYFTCCSSQVHRTTPLGLGSFIGALIMFANLTLVCSVLFGEFEVRDFREGEERNQENSATSRSSMAFSIMCMFLTVLYGGFAALTFAYSKSVMEELVMDEREEALSSTRGKGAHFVGGYDGYIGERFDVRRNTGFVAPIPPDATLT